MFWVDGTMRLGVFDMDLASIFCCSVSPPRIQSILSSGVETERRDPRADSHVSLEMLDLVGANTLL